MFVGSTRLSKKKRGNRAKRERGGGKFRLHASSACLLLFSHASTAYDNTKKNLHKLIFNMESRTIEGKDCPVQSVTVYLDRAEVVRTVSFTVDVLGQHEIKITDLSESLNPESIRVKGVGNSQILEVSHESTVVDDSKIANQALKDLKHSVSELTKKQKSLALQKRRLQEQQKHIDKYTENMLYGGPASRDPAGLAVSAATEILSFNFKEMASLDDRINQLEEESAKVEDEMVILRTEMLKCSSAAKGGGNNAFAVTVLVDILNSTGDISLQLSYVVSNTTWAPSYDIRVSTTSNVMDVTYYADVTQSTGEDWEDCDLFLSTSNPSIGSCPPPLPVRTVDWSYKIAHRRGSKSNSLAMASHRKNMKSKRGYNGTDDDDDMRERQGSFSLMDGDSGGLNNLRNLQIQSITNILPSAPPLPNGEGEGESVLTSGVMGSGEAGATTFTIPRKVNISSDSKPHKVTVTNETFSPQMVHYVSPNIDASAYLQAKVLNTSRFPLLASEKVSVFMDGNFISTTKMRPVSPGESFNIFLGVDPALKVEYRPCRTSAKTKGLFSSTEVKQYEYCTVLRNTKLNLCRVIVAEILPRSNDENISVELIEPTSASLSKLGDGKSVSVDQDMISALDSIGEGGVPGESAEATWPADFVTQNKVTNNIVWLKTIPAGEKVTLNFSYRVLWPKGKNVDIM